MAMTPLQSEALSLWRKNKENVAKTARQFAQQVEAENVSTFHTRVLWRPQSILPDIDFQGDVNELMTDMN